MQKVKPQSYLLALVAGIVGAVIMFLIMQLGISKGIAPFNVPPSAAMTIKAGYDPKPLALIVHLVYGAVASLLFMSLFRSRINVLNGILFSVGLWLVFTVIYAPIIGWGLFGYGHPDAFPKDSPLHIEPGPKFVLVTLGLHIIYGVVVALLDKWFYKTEFVRA